MACTQLQVINASLKSGGTNSPNMATIVTAATPLSHQAIYNFPYYVGWTGATGTEQLQIQVGPSPTTSGATAPTVYPVLNKQGQPVAIGTLRQGRRICLQFQNPNSSPVVMPAHFVLGNTQCPLVTVTAALVVPSPPVLGPI